MIRMQFIFSRTSLYPGQRLHLSVEQETQVQKAANEILFLTQPRWGEKRQIASSNLLALFMAGTVLTDNDDRRLLFTALRDLDREFACGRNFACAARALNALYDAMEAREQPSEVDWWIYLRERGLLGFSLYGI